MIYRSYTKLTKVYGNIIQETTQPFFMGKNLVSFLYRKINKKYKYQIWRSAKKYLIRNLNEKLN